MDEGISGAKRGGKTKLVLLKVHKALKRGCFIATNINVDISKLPLKNLDTTYYDGLIVKLPDVPTAKQLNSLGLGYQGDDIDETKNGYIIFDESALIFNSYNYRDVELQERFEFLINTGKKRYHVIYIVHDLETLSSRVRRSFIEYSTTCYSIHTLLYIQDSPFKKFVPQIHIAKKRLSSKGQTIKKGFARINFFSGKEVQLAYDTEQKYSEPLPKLAPLGKLKAQIPGASDYLYPKHPHTKSLPTPGYEFVDLRAPYTVLPPRLLGGSNNKKARAQQVKSLLTLISFFCFLIYVYTLINPREKEEITPPKEIIAQETSLQPQPQQEKTNTTQQCDFLSSLSYVQHSEAFTDNWFLELLKRFKPVVRDYNYNNPYIGNRFDYNLIFYDEKGKYAASTNPSELNNYGWYSFPWSRGLALLQKSYWMEEVQQGKILNRREVYILLQADTSPPMFNEAVASVKSGDEEGGLMTGFVSSVTQ